MKLKYLSQYVNYTIDDFVKLLSGKGLGGVKDVKYDELVTLIKGGKLKPGQQYRITDYQTVHYMVDGGGNQLLTDINKGSIEPLIVTATSSNQLDTLAQSELYPQDVIHYDWNGDNWLRDLSFADLTDSSLPKIVPGYRGTIFRRIDTKLNNSIGYDFRNVKFRRWKISMPAWSSTTTYYEGSRVLDSGYIYTCNKSNTLNVPVSNNNIWVKLTDLNLYPYVHTGGYYLGLTASSEYQDFLTFAESTSGKYSTCVKDNVLDSEHDDYDNWYTSATILTNNVFFLSDTPSPQIYSNKFSSGFDQNTFVGDVYGNKASYYFKRNLITGSFRGNTLGYNFYGNIVVGFGNNIIGNDFSGNAVASNFSNNVFGNFCNNNIISTDCIVNTIGNQFSGNRIGYYFTENTIHVSVMSNRFGDHNRLNMIKANFQRNTTPPNFMFNTIDTYVDSADLTASTHSVASYPCTIMKRPDNTYRVSYLDNTDTLRIVAINV